MRWQCAAIILMTLACTKAPVTESRAPKPEAPGATAPQPEPAKPPEPRVITVASGTPLVVRTTSHLSSKTAKPGDRFVASLEQPLIAEGTTIAHKGATVQGRVTRVDKGGRVKGRAAMAVTLSSLTDASGNSYVLRTNASFHQARSGVKRDAVKVGAASGAGAVIGAIAGGGAGAAIGAGAGAAGGTGFVLATRGPAAEIPAESVLAFALAQPLRVTPRDR